MTEEAEKGSEMGFNVVLDMLIKHFGSHILGLVMFLVIWVFVVAPQMERQQLDFEALQGIVVKLNDLQLEQKSNQTNMAEISRTLKETAQVVDTLARELKAR